MIMTTDAFYCPSGCCCTFAGMGLSRICGPSGWWRTFCCVATRPSTARTRRAMSRCTRCEAHYTHAHAHAHTHTLTHIHAHTHTRVRAHTYTYARKLQACRLFSRVRHERTHANYAGMYSAAHAPSIRASLQAILAGEYEFDSPYWDDITPAAKSFVSSLLAMDEGKRLSAEEVLPPPPGCVA